MKELTVSENLKEIKITDNHSKTEIKYAIFLNVLGGMSATFLCDIYLWLNSRPAHVTARWKGLPVFVYFIGGKSFPKFFSMSAKGYDGTVHLVNVDINGKEGEPS